MNTRLAARPESNADTCSPATQSTIGALLRSGLTDKQIAECLQLAVPLVQRSVIEQQRSIWPGRSPEQIAELRRALQIRPSHLTK